jgi:hypothetical protein
MKKVILLGDSIRMGYDKYVKDALAGVAEVYYPEENCKFAQYLLRFVHDWKATGKWPTDADIVHWNAGLWDVLELYGEEPMTGEAQYAEMIARIDRQLRRLFPKAKIIFGHALKNALIPVITYFGPMLAYIVTGSLVVEQIFAVPGIGDKFVNSITNRDYPLIMGTTIILAVFIVIMNLISDILYKVVDPRINLE